MQSWTQCTQARPSLPRTAPALTTPHACVPRGRAARCTRSGTGASPGAAGLASPSGRGLGPGVGVSRGGQETLGGGAALGNRRAGRGLELLRARRGHRAHCRTGFLFWDVLPGVAPDAQAGVGWLGRWGERLTGNAPVLLEPEALGPQHHDPQLRQNCRSPISD